MERQPKQEVKRISDARADFQQASIDHIKPQPVQKIKPIKEVSVKRG